MVLSSGFSEEIRIETPPASRADAFPIASSRLGAMVFTGTTSDRVMLYQSGALPGRVDDELPDFGEKSPAGAAISAASKAGLGKRYSWLDSIVPPHPNLADVWVDWLDAEKPATKFSRTLDSVEGVVTTKFVRDNSEFTEKLFISDADDLTVIHLRADKVGSLNFKIRLARAAGLPPATEIRVEDRRVLIMHGKVSDASDSPSFEVRAWLYPMESEVTPGEKDISILGEGEALVLIAAAVGPEGSPALTGIADRMKKYGFGGDDHPDISELWDGLLERHLKAQKAAMAEKE